MKSIALASLLFVLSGPVMADHFAMLAGYRDTARLQKQKASSSPPLFNRLFFSTRRQAERRFKFTSGSFSKQFSCKSDPGWARRTGSQHQLRPAVAGPATVQLMTDGLFSLQLFRGQKPETFSKTGGK